ncbi:hypothetical protein MOQ_003711 [Trypanosoma cruzi marinkellei]|uniref:Uncharacterized protein n=1 Tax=Trypanosoma cruzi marinkellei TaxID=85056 RepID=K2NTZ1_TRYCR|nr:hypothetical protein MOQ_003711 [Trypanosoma cruzi marinkellei]
MTKQPHLGILCVDVSELLRANARRKVTRRDNMLLYKGSYLITDPVPSWTPRSTSTHSRSNSPFHGSSVSSSRTRKSRKSRRSHRSMARRSGSKNSKDKSKRNDDFLEEAVPLKTDTAPAQGQRGEINVVGGYSSAVNVRRRESPAKRRAGDAHRTASPVSAWVDGRRLSPMFGGPNDSVSGSSSTLPPALLPEEQRPREQGPRERVKTPSSRPSSSQQEEEQQNRFPDVLSTLSDLARERLNVFMKSPPGRTFDNAQAPSQLSLSVEMVSDRNYQDKSGAAEDESEGVSLAMVGTLGTATVAPIPDPWGAPRPPRAKTNLRQLKNITESGAHSCSVRDARGVERVMILGAVPQLPRPVVNMPFAGRGRAAGAALPPVFRRAARVVATPTKRPKRF